MSTVVALKHGIGVIVVTHDPVVVEYADRMVTLDDLHDGRQAVS